MQDLIKSTLDKMDSWNTTNDWKAYDPFDGLSTPYTSILTLNNPILRIALQQSVRRLPVNIRPLIGIKPATSSKAMGFFAQGYLTLYKIYKNDKYLSKCKFCLDWLEKNPSTGYKGYCWGNHFDYQSRGGRIPKNVPSVVWSGLIGHAFMDAYEYLKNDKYFAIAASICDFIMNDLQQSKYPNSIHIAYTPEETDSGNKGNQIHNSSAIAASLLARVYNFNMNKNLLLLAKNAIQYTVDRQLDDGAWYYGEKPRFHWVDSFHTGYVLESINLYIKYSHDESYLPALKKGYSFYINTFFTPSGIPNYYHNKMRPLDIQCASQGIQTLLNMKSYDSSSLEIAERVALWSINNMFDTRGYFYFRKYPLMINKTPTLHWGQATMFASLAHLLANQLNN